MKTFETKSKENIMNQHIIITLLLELNHGQFNNIGFLVSKVNKCDSWSRESAISRDLTNLAI